MRSAILVMLCTVGDFTLFGAEGLNHWNVALQYPFSAFQNIIFADNKFVVIGSQSSIATSTDGVTWVNRHLDESKVIHAITFGNGRFIAVGYTLPNSSLVFTSPDGETWTEGTAPPEALGHIEFGLGQFVAISSSRIYSSPDGNSWTVVAYPDGATFERLTFANGYFNAKGSSVNLVSTNGVDWTPLVGKNTSINSIAYGNGIYVGVNPGTFIGTNGIDWNPQLGQLQLSGTLQQVAFGNGIFVAVGTDPNGGWGILYTSPDAKTWTRQLKERPFFEVRGLSGVAYGNGVFVVTGNNSVFTSFNGIDWTDAPGVSDKSFSSVVNGNGIIAAVGSTRSSGKVRSLVVTSPDGVKWTQHEFTNIISFNSIAYGNSVFAARFSNGLLTSTNGVEWNVHTLPFLSGNTISFVHDRFFLCGNGGVINTSTDALTWTQQATGVTDEIRAVAYGHGRFVAVGGFLSSASSRNVILTSTDGSNWQKLSSPPGNILRSVAFGNGRFVAVRWVGASLVSTNGLDWEPGSSIFERVGPDKIIFERGRFLTWDNFHQRLWSSLDGKLWAEHRLPGAPLWRPRDYTFYGDRLIAAGISTIWKSDLIPAPFVVSAAADDEIFKLNITETEPRTTDLELRYLMEITGTNGQRTVTTNVIQIPAGVFSQTVEPATYRFTQAQLTLLADPAYEVASPLPVTLTSFNPESAPRFRRSHSILLSSGELQIHLDAPFNSSVIIEESANLIQWKSIGTYTNAGDFLRLKLPVVRNESGRYYRARLSSE